MQDLQKDILDSLKALCDREEAFQVSPSISADYDQSAGDFCTKEFQHLRKYLVLCDLAPCAYMVPAFFNSVYKDSRFLHLRSAQNFHCFCDWATPKVLASVSVEQNRCFPAHYISSMLKDLYIIKASGFEVAFYPCAAGESLIAEKLAALSQGVFLQGAPYMVKDFEC